MPGPGLSTHVPRGQKQQVFQSPPPRSLERAHGVCSWTAVGQQESQEPNRADWPTEPACSRRPHDEAFLKGDKITQGHPSLLMTLLEATALLSMWQNSSVLRKLLPQKGENGHIRSCAKQPGLTPASFLMTLGRHLPFRAFPYSRLCLPSSDCHSQGR